MPERTYVVKPRIAAQVDEDLKTVHFTIDGLPMQHATMEELEQLASGARDIVHNLAPLDQQNAASVLQNVMNYGRSLALQGIYKTEAGAYVLAFEDADRQEHIISNWGDYRAVMNGVRPGSVAW